jgi:hypothetical protein
MVRLGQISPELVTVVGYSVRLVASSLRNHGRAEMSKRPAALLHLRVKARVVSDEGYRGGLAPELSQIGPSAAEGRTRVSSALSEGDFSANALLNPVRLNTWFGSILG